MDFKQPLLFSSHSSTSTAQQSMHNTNTIPSQHNQATTEPNHQPSQTDINAIIMELKHLTQEISALKNEIRSFSQAPHYSLELTNLMHTTTNLLYSTGNLIHATKRIETFLVHTQQMPSNSIFLPPAPSQQPTINPPIIPGPQMQTEHVQIRQRP